MNEIPSAVAFWIFSAWARMTSHLHVRGTRSGKSLALESGILWSDPKDYKISLELVDDKGRKDEWRISLKGAQFFFEVPESGSAPTFGEGIWLLLLLAKLPDGSQILLGERFIEPTFAVQK